jgi:hypothetical protein
MTETEKLQAIWHLYESEHQHKPARTSEAIAWAVKKHLLREPPAVPGVKVLERRLANALRQEYDTYKGRRYRVNHAVHVSTGGRQQSFWAIMGYAEHDFMVRAFGQRREQVVGECSQLHTDVIVYNDMNDGKIEPVELRLDFTDDVEERENS